MGKVMEFVTHFVVTRDDQDSFYAVKCLPYPEGGSTYVAVALEVGGATL